MSGGARQAAAFLTAVVGARPPTGEALRWFPAVGVALGVGLGAVWVLAQRTWPAPVAAVVVVTADLALTGLLHVDGLVDAADGLLPHLPAERRLVVMAEPAVGAFGVVVAVAVLLLRWAALAALVADVRLLASLWCLSRTVMAACASMLPYARAGGLATAFLDTEGRRPVTAAVLAGVVTAVALAVWWSTLAGLAAVVAGLVAAAGVVCLARRRLGGFTGDVLGAVGVVSESAGLLVAAARW